MALVSHDEIIATNLSSLGLSDIQAFTAIQFLLYGLSEPILDTMRLRWSIFTSQIAPPAFDNEVSGLIALGVGLRLPPGQQRALESQKHLSSF